MKKIFKLILIYALGMMCVFTLVWRADNVNESNKSLASNYNDNNVLINN